VIGDWWRESHGSVHAQQAMFAKNLSMLGAALLITQLGAGPFSVDERNRPGARTNPAS